MSVSLIQQGQSIHIKMNRPEVHNAFDENTIAALTDAFDQAGNEPGRAIVLEAEGKHFSAGADLNWMRKMAEMSHEENILDANRLAQLMHTIDQAGKPVICKIQGAAYGGALGLICAADIAICDEKARFCLSEVRLGLLPAVISPYVVRAMGPRQAQRYFMTGEVFDAAEALRLGIVHQVCNQGQLDETVEQALGYLLNGAPTAQCRSRQLINLVAHRPIDEVQSATAEMIAELRSAPEGKAGVQAFLNKTKPHWQEH